MQDWGEGLPSLWVALEGTCDGSFPGQKLEGVGMLGSAGFRQPERPTPKRRQ